MLCNVNIKFISLEHNVYLFDVVYTNLRIMNFVLNNYNSLFCNFHNYLIVWKVYVAWAWAIVSKMMT